MRTYVYFSSEYTVEKYYGACVIPRCRRIGNRYQNVRSGVLAPVICEDYVPLEYDVV
jgi:hypothetical protein